MCAEDAQGPEAAQVQIHLGPSGASQSWGLRVGGFCLEGDEVIGRAVAPSPLAGRAVGELTVQDIVPGPHPAEGELWKAGFLVQQLLHKVAALGSAAVCPPALSLGAHTTHILFRGQLKWHPGQFGRDIYNIYISQCLWEGRSLTLMVTK